MNLMNRPAIVEGYLRNHPEVWGGLAVGISSNGDGKAGSADGPKASGGVNKDIGNRIGSLPPRERWLLCLWYGERLAAPQIATLFGVSRVECYRMRRRALERLAVPGKERLSAAS